MSARIDILDGQRIVRLDGGAVIVDAPFTFDGIEYQADRESALTDHRAPAVGNASS
jgi:hypothetical protein